MKYGIISPPPPLADYVKCFWFIEHHQSYVHHAFAYPYPELIFCYKGHFQYQIGHEMNQTISSGIFGQTQSFSQVSLPDQPFGILGIYFYPHALPQLFGWPASAFTNQFADIRSFLGKDGEMLEEKIFLAPDNHQRIKLVSDFLESRLKNVRTEFFHICASIKEMLSFHPTVTATELAENNFLSIRHFERRFKELSGFNPKLFLRITRFNAVINSRPGYKSLTDLGIACGYYDQAHFVHDFKKFSGISPKEYFNDKTITAMDRGTVIIGN